MARLKAKLTQKQEQFCLAYIETGDASESYRRAYRAGNMQPVTINKRASELLSDRVVAGRIREIQTKAAKLAELKAADVMNEIRLLAFSSIKNLVDERGMVKLPHELDVDTARCVASFKIDPTGKIEYKLWDKNSALDKASKILGLFEKDNKQKTDPLSELARALQGNSIGPVKGGNA